jgi:hypothetical protein
MIRARANGSRLPRGCVHRGDSCCGYEAKHRQLTCQAVERRKDQLPDRPSIRISSTFVSFQYSSTADPSSGTSLPTSTSLPSPSSARRPRPASALRRTTARCLLATRFARSSALLPSCRKEGTVFVPMASTPQFLPIIVLSVWVLGVPCLELFCATYHMNTTIKQPQRQSLSSVCCSPSLPAGRRGRPSGLRALATLGPLRHPHRSRPHLHVWE